MAAVTHDEEPAFEPQMQTTMQGPLASSLLLHAVIIVIAIVGLPYITPELPDIVDPITVELIEVSEITQTNKPPPPDPVRRPKPEQQSEEPPKPVQPQQTAITPPKPAPPKPPEPKKMEAPPPKPEPPAPKEVTPEPAKAVTPPKPEKRPEAPAEPEQAQPEEFNSLLRNLMKTEEPPTETNKPGDGKPSSMLTRFSQQMSVSELESLRRQLSQCWSLMAGARYAEDLIVDIKLFMNPDRTIRDARIENQIRYSADSYFRAAADSALRAVYRCSPLDLPPNKYDLWKTITVTFDPRTML